MKSYRRLGIVIGLFIPLVLLVFAVATPQIAEAQTAKTIKYGDIADGEITSAKTKVLQLYRFSGQQGDKVSILMLRRSGNLRPQIILTDPTLPQDQLVLAASKIIANGTLAGIANFSLPETKSYVIIATRENLDKGTTTGQYRLMLIKGKADAIATDEPTDEPTQVTDEATPTRRPTATRRPRPSPTPADEEPTPEEEPTETPEPVVSDEPVQSFEVGTAPVYSLWTGANLFVSNSGDGTLSMLDADGKSVKTIKAGVYPFAMAWDGARLWVADLGASDQPADTVNVFDKTGRKVGTYKVGAQPFSLSYDKENKRMWIALFGENKIVAVDAKGQIQTTIDTDTNPNTVLWTGDKLWATLSGTTDSPNNQVIAIDADGNIIDTFTVGKSPADLAWNDTDAVLYVANFDDNSISVLDADGQPVGTLKPGKQPAALVWDGTHLWVSLYGDKAVVALSNKGKVLKKFPLDTNPNGITYDGSRYVWVSNQGPNDDPGNTVTRIDVEAALSEQ
jgi:DNA-binding beta-propeller fold protein YncE